MSKASAARAGEQSEFDQEVAAAELVPGLESGLSWASLGGAYLRAVANLPNLWRAGTRLSLELAQVSLGLSELEPPPSDRRFADPAWNRHGLYHRVAQAYLAWCEAMNELVGSAGLGSWREEQQARFAAELVTSALSPTNFLLSNPAALREAIATGGASLAKGMANMVRDIVSNGGMPSQVDRSKFRVGENLAATPGAVVVRDEMFELLQYAPSTASVGSRPLLFVPPQINKYYFVDLAPGRSLVEHAVAQGVQTFMISWKNPSSEAAGWNLSDYVGACLRAFDAATEITGSDTSNVFGLCAGGITATAMAAYMAATGDDRLHSITYAVTLLDFSEPALVGMFADPAVLNLASRYSKQRGVLPGSDLARIFSWLRPNDLVWNYWVNNYLLGKEPPAFDILAWNADATNLPAALHADFLEIMKGDPAKLGGVEIRGVPVDTHAVDCEVYVVGGETDHITPWRGCYRTTALLGRDPTFVLSSSGHIQTPVCPPGNPKSRYRTGPAPGPDPDAWLEDSEEHKGSWWEHWSPWIVARSGSSKPAPGKLGSRRHRPIEPAPGRYVHEPA